MSDRQIALPYKRLKVVLAIVYCYFKIMNLQFFTTTFYYFNFISNEFFYNHVFEIHSSLMCIAY